MTSENPDVKEARRLLAAMKVGRITEIIDWLLYTGGLSRLLAHIEGLEKERARLRDECIQEDGTRIDWYATCQAENLLRTMAEKYAATKAAEVERLREALLDLNAALDEMWNDPLRDRLIAARAHNRRIHAAQQASRAALAFPTTDDTKGPTFVGVDEGRGEDRSCTVTGHLDDNGSIAIDIIEFPDPEGKGRIIR